MPGKWKETAKIVGQTKIGKEIYSMCQIGRASCRERVS